MPIALLSKIVVFQRETVAHIISTFMASSSCDFSIAKTSKSLKYKNKLSSSVTSH